MWSGWTVHVETVGSGNSAQTYYAHISDRIDAVKAVKDYVGSTSAETTFEARKPIQSTVFAAMGIAVGEVRLPSREAVTR
jgi:hypothetical protein